MSVDVDAAREDILEAIGAPTDHHRRCKSRNTGPGVKACDCYMRRYAAGLAALDRLLAVLKEQADRIERLQREVANAAVDAWQSRAEALEAEVTQLRAERDDLDRRGIALHAAYAREVRRVGEAEERAEAAERLAHDRGEANAQLREAIASALTSLGTGPAKDGYAFAVLSEALAGVVPPEQAPTEPTQ